MKKLGELLLEQGKLSESDAEKALLAKSELGHLLGQVLVKLGLVSDQDVAAALSKQLNIPLLSGTDLPPESIYLANVSHNFLLSNNVAPMGMTDAGITFPANVPQGHGLVEALARALDRAVFMALGVQSNIIKALQNHVKIDEEQGESINGSFSGQSEDDCSKPLQGSMALSSDTVPTVAVLLCCYNGGKFLAQQLESIAEQADVRVSIYVSDDGSQDETQNILQTFRDRWGEDLLSVGQGPRRGHAENFFSLIFSKIEGDYFAYADQDDIWATNKLSRAVEALSSLPDDRPALYCSRSLLIDIHGRNIGLSPLFSKQPSFANALIQNIAGGNTMVMNLAARDLLSAVGPVDIVTHDWWTYILVAGSGGLVIYDERPSISYRQHKNNLVGSSRNWSVRFKRFWLALQGRNRIWNTQHIEALQQSRSYLTEENQRLLDDFRAARDQPFPRRLLHLWRTGVYAQSMWGNLGLIAAALLKKL
ncbi:MAG: glycosyltransferase [Halioglobus sp.]|nr:glycosyltransferase [Halioglobus sp.]